MLVYVPKDPSKCYGTDSSRILGAPVIKTPVHSPKISLPITMVQKLRMRVRAVERIPMTPKMMRYFLLPLATMLPAMKAPIVMPKTLLPEMIEF